MFPSTEKLLGIVQSFKPDRQYVARSLFTNAVTDGETYSFDIVHRNKGITNFVPAEADAIPVKTMAKERIEARLHTLKNKKRISKVLLRLEQAAGKMSREAFNAKLVAEMEDLNDIQDRTWEAAMWNLLRTGIWSGTEDGVSFSYDFGLTNKSTAGNLWNVAADATPLSDLQTVNKVLRRVWGEPGTEIYLSSDALRMAMQCDDTTERLAPETLDAYHRDGVIPNLSTLKLHLMDSGYTPDGGSWTPYLSDNGTDANIAIIKAPGPVGEFVQGTPVDGEAGEGVYGRFVKAYNDNSDSKVPHFLQEWFAAPGLTMPNKVYALKVF